MVWKGNPLQAFEENAYLTSRWDIARARSARQMRKLQRAWERLVQWQRASERLVQSEGAAHVRWPVVGVGGRGCSASAGPVVASWWLFRYVVEGAEATWPDWQWQCDSDCDSWLTTWWWIGWPWDWSERWISGETDWNRESWTVNRETVKETVKLKHWNFVD
jgi:hypothetical protein